MSVGYSNHVSGERHDRDVLLHQMMDRFQELYNQALDAMLLDFYHLSEHVWDTGKVCWGAGDEAKAWVQQQLHDLKHLGGRPVLAAIDEAEKKLRASAKQKALRSLRNYPGAPGFRTNRGDVQEPHAPAQTNRHEMGR